MVSRKQRRRRVFIKIAGFTGWTTIVAMIFLWQTATYSGVMSLIGEWQFDVLGRHYPTFDYVLLVFLLCLPGYLLFLRPRRAVSVERPEALVLRSAKTVLRAVFGAAIVLGVAVLATLIIMLTLPRASGPEQVIDLSKPVVSLPAQGPTAISGDILYDRTAGLDEDMLFFRHSVRFAPIVGSPQTGELQFFVQLPPDVQGATLPQTTFHGVLQREGLPGEIVRLFRYAGFQVDNPQYVVFAEPRAMRWPYLAAMTQFAVGGLLALAVGLLQRRRVQRIDGQVHARPTGTEAMTAA